MRFIRFIRFYIQSRPKLRHVHIDERGQLVFNENGVVNGYFLGPDEIRPLTRRERIQRAWALSDREWLG